METKNAALIARLCAVSDRITHGDAGIDSVEAVNEATEILHSQAAEIERLTSDRDVWKVRAEFSYSERDQLKAKNEKLVEALQNSQHFITNRITYQGEFHSKLIKANESAIAHAAKELKENT